MGRDYTRVHRTTEEVLQAAEYIRSKGPRNFQRSIYLYYMARYWVSVHEARNFEIPIQVWNEYRNALDHFYRMLTADGLTIDDKVANDEPNRARMEAHILRALLDIMKLFCTRAHDQYRELIQQYHPHALRLVEDGQFQQRLLTTEGNAEKALEDAKVNDDQLGQGHVEEDKVIQKYLDACFLYDQMLREVRDKIPQLSNAQASHGMIHKDGWVRSMLSDYKVAIVGGLIVAGLVALGSCGLG